MIPFKIFVFFVVCYSIINGNFIGRDIRIQTSLNEYIVTEYDGSITVGNHGESESFRVINVGNNKIAFVTLDNMYLSCNGDNNTLTTVMSVGVHEMFVLEYIQKPNIYAIRSRLGTYVSARYDVLLCDQTVPGIDEYFVIETGTNNNENWSDYIGLDLSVGFQSNPINAMNQAQALSRVNVNRFRLYFNDVDVAKEILKYKFDAKFALELTAWDVANGITSSIVLDLLTPFASIARNIDMIFLGNEPLNVGAGIVRFDELNKALEIVITTVRSWKKYKHIQVSIPFSLTAVSDSFPVSNGNFIEPKNGDTAVNSNGICTNCVKSNTLSNSYMKQILNTYYYYNMPFSIQVYPFFACAFNVNIPINYCLGSVRADGGDGNLYNGMIEAQYVATKNAIIDLIGNIGNNIEIIISETGWSSYSDSILIANHINAFNYYKNSLIITQLPSSPLYQKRVYFFEAFDEDLKGPTGNHENHFGWFDLNGNSKYDIISLGLIIDNNISSKKVIESFVSSFIDFSQYTWFNYIIGGIIALVILCFGCIIYCCKRKKWKIINTGYKQTGNLTPTCMDEINDDTDDNALIK